jgi:hypothetical protein
MFIYIYDKRDDFNFPIVNFPFICSNIPAAHVYGVYIYQLIQQSASRQIALSAKHAALRKKNKDWLARNQNNVSEWSDMSTRGLLYQLRDIYSIYMCCWNVATYKWKVHNGKIEIISFVVNIYKHYSRSVLKYKIYEYSTNH